MKTLLKMTLAAAILMSAGIKLTYAQSGENLYKRIPIHRVSSFTQADGVETYYGKVINLDELAERPSGNRVAELLERHNIELRNGEVVYPEEVEWAIRREIDLANPDLTIGKAPHTPD